MGKFDRENVSIELTDTGLLVAHKGFWLIRLGTTVAKMYFFSELSS